MMWEAFAGLALVAGAAWFAAWRWGRYRYEAGYQAKISDMSALRAQRRAERRAATMDRHRLAPFPDGEWTEKLATTGELRELAEAGDMATVRGHVAAFWRILGQDEWTRKRASA